MPRKICWIAALTLFASLDGCRAAENRAGCGWRPFPVAAAQPDRREYVGRGERIELRLQNERTEQEPEVFPEAPVRIRQIAGGGSCELAEGDIRVRSSIHVSADERRLIVLEYTGSNDSIVLYDTASCRKIAQLDVSGSRWALQPQRLLVGKDCKGADVASCGATREYGFGGECNTIEAAGSPGR